MTKKSTKKALVLSVLSLVVCITMLVGTTFAWFTDSVTSTNNIIKSGNLDVVLEYSTDMEKWNTVTSDTNVFKDGALWEPGYTEVVYLKVSNAGSLALKYQLGVNVASEVEGVNVDNDTFKLSDYIKFGVVDTVSAKYADRDDAREDVKDDSAVLSAGYTKQGAILADGDPNVIAMVVYMPEEVGNEANHIAGHQPVINLGINLYATQYTAEADSFGIDYDADAVYADKTYNPAPEATLADTLATINNANDEIVLLNLSSDVTWDTGASHGSTPWVEAGAAVKELIVNGNGHTITATGAGVGPIRMANGGTLTIKNATIVDETASYAEDSWEFTYLEFAGSLVFENVKFTSGITVDGADAVYTNCTFNSPNASEYSVWISNGDATFTGCTFTGTRGPKLHEDYGSEIGTVTFDDCTFDNLSEKPGVVIGNIYMNGDVYNSGNVNYTNTSDTTVIIKNSDFINCQPGDQGKYIYESDTDVTTFNFDCNENNEVIKSVTPDLTISTAEQFFAFANDVNVNGNSYAGKLVVLGADIDLKNVEWAPIGQTGGNGVATYFQGMFDGKGYTVSNLKITNNEYDEGANYAAGLFGFIDAADAQIVNLNVKNASVSAHHWTGVIAGYISGKISGCTVTNATVTCTHANGNACGDKAGVIAGYINSGVVTGNTVKDCTVTAGRDAGQVVGAAKTTQAYGNTIYSVTVSAAGDCTGADVRNEEIGRVM